METKTFVPPDFYCPISGELMINPVIGKDGHSYEKAEILSLHVPLNGSMIDVSNCN